MGCFIVLFALISPRLALFLVWIFSDVLSRAFDSWIVPCSASCNWYTPASRQRADTVIQSDQRLAG
jgi:hypothetical protein